MRYMSQDVIDNQLEKHYLKLCDIVSKTLKDDENEIEYRNLLTRYRLDKTHSDGTVFLGLERAPASREHHHAYIGGLVVHLLEMISFYRTLKSSFSVREVDVIKGIINHDLHKAYCTYTLENGVFVRKKDYLEENLGETGKTLHLLKRGRIDVNWQLLSSLLNSHGGWSEWKTEKVPQLGRLLYLLDDLSCSCDPP